MIASPCQREGRRQRIRFLVTGLVAGCPLPPGREAPPL